MPGRVESARKHSSSSEKKGFLEANVDLAAEPCVSFNRLKIKQKYDSASTKVAISPHQQSKRCDILMSCGNATTRLNYLLLVISPKRGKRQIEQRHH